MMGQTNLYPGLNFCKKGLFVGVWSSVKTGRKSLTRVTETRDTKWKTSFLGLRWNKIMILWWGFTCTLHTMCTNGNVYVNWVEYLYLLKGLCTIYKYSNNTLCLEHFGFSVGEGREKLLTQVQHSLWQRQTFDYRGYFERKDNESVGL